MTPRPLLILLLLISGAREPVEVVQPPTSGFENGCPVTVIEVIDADTIRGHVHLPFGVCLTNQVIRANDYDAWESSKRRNSEAAGEITDTEVVKGKQAAKELCDILSEPDVVLYVKPGLQERDNYGRLLGSLSYGKGQEVRTLKEAGSRKGWIRKTKGAKE